MKKTLLLLLVLVSLISCNSGGGEGKGGSSAPPVLSNEIPQYSYIRYTAEMVEGKNLFEGIMISPEIIGLVYYHRTSGGEIEKVIEATDYYYDVLSTNEVELTSQTDGGDIKRIRFEGFKEDDLGRRTICINDVCHLYYIMEYGDL